MEGATPVVQGLGGDSTPCCLRSSWHVGFAESRKAEDVSIVTGSKSFSSGVSLYAVADGHNGTDAARHVQAALPLELERQLGSGPGAASPEAVLRGLARAFVAVDDAVCHKFFQSGCTLTAAVISGDVLTLANVGDSKCVLDTGAEVVELSADHRIGCNPGELARLEAAGGHLARLNEYGSGPSAGVHEGLGPVRLWPGGIMVGRALGDKDVGELLLAAPHIRQVRIPPTGARLVIASDGLWDAVPAGRVARVLRQHGTAKGAAMQAISSVAASRGGLLSDDATVVVVDLLPPGVKDFKEVLAQFQRRITTVLSSPTLATLALAEAEEDAAAAKAAAGAHKAATDKAAAPRRGGLFRCFSRPSVLEDGSPASPCERSARAGSQRGDFSAYSGRGELSARSGRRGDFSACSGRADFSAYSGRGEFSARGGVSLRGGSERSVRGGVARDPSVRGYQRATSLQVLCDADTALWTAAGFGHPPSLSSLSHESVSATSTDGGVARYSPRGLLDGTPYGVSFNSLSSDDDVPSHLSSHDLPYVKPLARAMSLMAPALAHTVSTAPISRKNSAPAMGDKKCRGGSAAAALLHHN